MKQANFKDWTLTALDNAFDLKQVWAAKLMDQWTQSECELTTIDKAVLFHLQQSLIRGGRAWNEAELENKFISPMIMQAHIDDEEIGYFLERNLSCIIGDYQLAGIVDGMIATGFREPNIPMFCMHEYKRSIENQGSPDAQVLVAMLVAQAMNHNKHPIYGLFVVGLVWNFIILDQQYYCISQHYNADGEQIFNILTMLKTLRKTIKKRLRT
jgi:hypothetical protein